MPSYASTGSGSTYGGTSLTQKYASSSSTGGSGLSITSYANSTTGGFGMAALERARAAGMTDAQIRQQISRLGITVGPTAASALGIQTGGGTTKPPAPVIPGPTEPAGPPPAPRPPAAPPPVAPKPPVTGTTNSSNAAVESLLLQYRNRAEEQARAATDSASRLEALTRERDRYRTDYEALKDLGNRQRAQAEDSYAWRLRTGSTIGGTNATQGTLQNGSPVAAGDASGRTRTAYGRSTYRTDEDSGNAPPTAGASSRLSTGQRYSFRYGPS